MERLHKLAELAEKNNCHICVSSFYHITVLPYNSFSYRHGDWAVKIKPEEILQGEWDEIKKRIYYYEDNFVSFSRRSHPTEGEQLLAEILFPDYCAPASFKRPSQVINRLVRDYEHTLFNVGMVYDCVSWCLEYRESLAFMAPCFIRYPDMRIYEDVLPEDFVRLCYSKNCLARML